MKAGVIEYSVVNSINNKRRLGMADEQIAFELRLGISQVRSVPLPRPQSSRSRAVQHMQLQQMAQQLVLAVEKGDREAMMLLLKVQRREADLLGLDAPKETVSRNFNVDAGNLQEIPTHVLRQMIVDQAGLTIDVTPDPSDLDPGTAT